MLHRVKPKDFEQAVLELAMTTRVPLSRANIAFYSGVGTKQADKWLDELVRDGLLEFDSDDNGDILYVVTGAKRPSSGPTELTRCSACQRASGAGSRCTRCGKLLDAQLRALKDEVDRAGSAFDLVRRGSDILSHSGGGPGEKNLILGGLLGLLGPIGWFYAAPLKEAGIATLVFVLVAKMLPSFLFYPVLGLLTPLFVLLGAMYAWRYNRSGERTSLFLEEGTPKRP
jgi:hypothetical protein